MQEGIVVNIQIASSEFEKIKMLFEINKLLKQEERLLKMLEAKPDQKFEIQDNILSIYEDIYELTKEIESFDKDN